MSQSGVGSVEAQAPDDALSRARLGQALDRHSAMAPTRPVEAPEVDPDTLKALRELGYVE
jgi:hypothetical protein